MKLYYNPRSRAVIAKWMLDECGVDYEIIPVDFEKREHKTPEFLKINPRGNCPPLSTAVRRSSRVRRSVSIWPTIFPKPIWLPRSVRRNAVAISR
jgi:hypothetical protein